MSSILATPTIFPSSIHTVSVNSLEHCFLPHCSLPEYCRDFAGILRQVAEPSLVFAHKSSQLRATTVINPAETRWSAQQRFYVRICSVEHCLGSAVTSARTKLPSSKSVIEFRLVMTERLVARFPQLITISRRYLEVLVRFVAQAVINGGILITD